MRGACDCHVHAFGPPERYPYSPDVPTLHELGFTHFDDVTWNGVVAPAGTPAAALRILHSAIAKGLANPDLRRRYGERGIELMSSASPEEFTGYVRSEADAFLKLVKEAGIQVE